MDERTIGIILRLRPLTETSLIVHWLTVDHGRLATVAKGARRPKSPLRGKLDLFYRAEFSFARSRRSDLHILREVSLADTHPALREDLQRLRQAAYCAALIEQSTETDTPLPELFALVDGVIAQLDREPAVARTVLAFEIQLLGELGLSPEAAATRLSPGTQQMLRQFASASFAALTALCPSAAQQAELGGFLRGFLLSHLGRIPHGRQAALGQAK